MPAWVYTSGRNKVLDIGKGSTKVRTHTKLESVGFALPSWGVRSLAPLCGGAGGTNTGKEKRSQMIT